MTNIYKQLFGGKPWSQEQIARWEETRSKGRARFAIGSTLLWGTGLTVGTLITDYFRGRPFSAGVLLTQALFYYLGGLVLGLYSWTINEDKYRESLNAK